MEKMWKWQVMDGGIPHAVPGYPHLGPGQQPGKNTGQVKVSWDGDRVLPGKAIEPVVGSIMGWRWSTSPPRVDRQTFPSMNFTFPRTSYVGGNTLQEEQ